jgi:hypothetical protein
MHRTQKTTSPATRLRLPWPPLSNIVMDSGRHFWRPFSLLRNTRIISHGSSLLIGVNKALSQLTCCECIEPVGRERIIESPNCRDWVTVVRKNSINERQPAERIHDASRAATDRQAEPISAPCADRTALHGTRPPAQRRPDRVGS